MGNPSKALTGAVCRIQS